MPLFPCPFVSTVFPSYLVVVIGGNEHNRSAVHKGSALPILATRHSPETRQRTEHGINKGEVTAEERRKMGSRTKEKGAVR